MSERQIHDDKLSQSDPNFTTSRNNMVLTKRIRPRDLIADRIDLEIEAYKAKSFSNFTQIGILLLQPAEDAIEVFISDRWVGFNKYIFDWWSPRKKAVEVRLSGRSKRVYIKHIGKWKTVAEYLSLLDPAIPSSAESSWDVLWAWWRINGKTFRLLDLPGEVRDLIYEHSYGPCVHPYPDSPSRRLGPKGLILKAAQSGRELMKINIQISREARDILFLRTSFRLERYGLIPRLLRNLSQRSRIRRLDLALSHLEYFRLFGLKVAGTRIYQISGRVQALRHMQLTSLRLHIGPPSFATESDHFDAACQVVVVKWLLNAAWRWVRGHPVVVTGYVKNTQKTEFEARCKQEQSRLAGWKLQMLAIDRDENDLAAYDEYLSVAEVDADGGVRLDGQQAEETRTHEVDDECVLPPPCRCDPPCILQRWSAV